MDERPRGAAIFAQINIRIPEPIHRRIEYARETANALRRERKEDGDVSKNAIVVAALDDALPQLPESPAER